MSMYEDDDLVPFSELPKDVQEVVLKGLTEPQEWTNLNDIKLTAVKNPGRRLRYLRLEREWTEQELATKANVNVTDVSTAEENFGKSNMEAIRKITATFGTTPEELMFKCK